MLNCHSEIISCHIAFQEEEVFFLSLIENLTITTKQQQILIR
jgi:hypothetical protein